MSTMERITEAAGWDAAIKVVGYWGGREMYVPDSLGPDHEVSKIVGYDAAVRLVSEFGGETVWVPAMNSRIDGLRKAGMCKALARYGVPVRLIAIALKISDKRVEQHLKEPRREGQRSLI